MKTTSILVTTALLVGSVLASAGLANANPQDGSGMGMSMAPANMSHCAMNAQDQENLQAQMHKMQTQMSEIMATANPAKRDELLQNHMNTINEMMGMMHNMHGDGSQMMQGSMEQGMGHHSDS